MFDLNGSEVSWLIYADWLEDQDISSGNMRELAVDPPLADCFFEELIDYQIMGMSLVGSIGHLVGPSDEMTDQWNDNFILYLPEMYTQAGGFHPIRNRGVGTDFDAYGFNSVGTEFV
jgi:hypothetical protein